MSCLQPARGRKNAIKKVNIRVDSFWSRPHNGVNSLVRFARNPRLMPATARDLLRDIFVSRADDRLNSSHHSCQRPLDDWDPVLPGLSDDWDAAPLNAPAAAPVLDAPKPPPSRPGKSLLSVRRFPKPNGERPQTPAGFQNPHPPHPAQPSGANPLCRPHKSHESPPNPARSRIPEPGVPLQWVRTSTPSCAITRRNVADFVTGPLSR